MCSTVTIMCAYVSESRKGTCHKVTHTGPYNTRKQDTEQHRTDHTIKKKYTFLCNWFICYVCKAGPFWRNQCPVRNKHADLDQQDRSSAPIYFVKGCIRRILTNLQILVITLAWTGTSPHAAKLQSIFHKDMLIPQAAGGAPARQQPLTRPPRPRCNPLARSIKFSIES